ncbi:MAG: RluA family pseudouridine synthase, partial [Planctomycetota bacterium]|nr:RluA family pseudouridine synthase [Planctomycetota bacterium]
HQIRVHAAAFGHPILGDDQYGDRAANRLAKEVCGLRRQALHCWRMSFPHPQTGIMMSLEAPLPADLWAALAAAHLSDSAWLSTNKPGCQRDKGLNAPRP